LAAIGNAISKNQPAIIVVDSDCDGMTSAALLINYLYKIFPTWVSNFLTWKMHDGKQHGLKDCIDEIVEKKYSLVLCPDSASNDYEEHKRIREYGGETIVLDHHLADKVSEDAIIINNQLSEYPNKELSGVGVVWQFCRFIDNFFNLKFADNYLDLVALGLCADMMSLKSFETRYLITKGFKKDNIKNPFIEGMLEKNSFPLSKSDYLSAQNDMACTSIGAAFFIVPLVNAMTRTGTQTEKELLFKSMLDHQAFIKILSNKRGHKEGEKETILAQAVRTATNVKNRQTRAEEAGMALLESKIVTENLLDHKILLFKLKPNEMEPNIRGLVANKMMAKYQRPCLVLTYFPEEAIFEGSGRGYTKTGIVSLKDILI
jgi:single-stranded-DNA-specific exonuclease